MAPVPGEKFYFGRFVIDIKAADSEVPRIDAETVKPYDQLGLSEEFYRGQVDADGRLVYLETWLREAEDEIPLDTPIDGKPLGDHQVPIVGSDTFQQTPQFFTLRNDAWHLVPASQTEGESRFIRLRWLKSLDGDTLGKDAELFRQHLVSITRYSYDASGKLTLITRETDRTDFRPEVIYPLTAH